MRAYERTHKWITFTLNLCHLHPQLAMKLGEAKSKCDHVAGAPLRPEVAKALHRVYLAKGVLATTAIEGNTLSEEQVQAAIDGKLTLPPSKEYQKNEIRNIVDACNSILDYVLIQDDAPLTPKLIRAYNLMVLKGLDVEDGVVPGEIRKHSVGILSYRGAPAEDCEYLLDRLCDWLNGPGFDQWPDSRVEMAIVKAVIAHLYLAWIHPFGDGNGRTARLVEFHLLLQAGIPTPAVHLLSDHYNETRSEYYRQLDHASRSGGDVFPFLEYAVQGFVDGLVGQLASIRKQQWDDMWKSYVHEQFKDRHTPAAARQRRLVLDLSEVDREGVKIADLRTLSPRVAIEYATKTKKAISRDLSVLHRMNLIVEFEDRVAANKNVILAFLPSRRVDENDGSSTPADD